MDPPKENEPTKKKPNTKSRANVKVVIIEDKELINAIYAIRKSGDDPNLLDRLAEIIGNRKIMLRYKTDVDTKFVFITRNVVWKLRSFFLHKGDGLNVQNTGEYINDVFIENDYDLEICELK